MITEKQAEIENLERRITSKEVMLVWLANILYHFNDRELYRADKEVKDIADGQYDWRIDRIDRGRGGGMSR